MFTMYLLRAPESCNHWWLMKCLVYRVVRKIVKTRRRKYSPLEKG